MRDWLDLLLPAMPLVMAVVLWWRHNYQDRQLMELMLERQAAFRDTLEAERKAQRKADADAAWAAYHAERDAAEIQAFAPKARVYCLEDDDRG